MTAWQPIETAPKDGTTILVFFDGGDMVLACWSENVWHSDDRKLRPGWEPLHRVYDVEDAIFPTHWMPMPASPGSLHHTQ
jgi:hypothetical protein